MPAIIVENLYKQYQLGQVSTGTISHDLNRWFHKVRGKEDPYEMVTGLNTRAIKDSSEYVWALQNINFEVKQGEVLGIIGKNGAGKSTLLKILSKVTAPTKGTIKIRGRIASLLEVGTGFHPELTGRENIFLNGAILGMTKSEIRFKFDEIVAFSGVEKYIDTPVKRYSSGMYVRLAFAVAAHLEPEILIVDEVLAVGDAEFQKKCLGKMGEVAKEGRTVLFVSHNMPSIKAMCNKGIVMKNGEVNFNGEILDAIYAYHLDNTETNNFIFKKGELINNFNEPIQLTDFNVVPRKGNLISMFSGIDFVLRFKSNLEFKNIDLTFEVVNQEDIVIFHNGGSITDNNNSKKIEYNVICSLPDQLLNAGVYYVNLIFGENQRILLKNFKNVITFEVLQDIVGSNSGKLPGFVFPKLKISVEPLTL